MSPAWNAKGLSFVMTSEPARYLYLSSSCSGFSVSSIRAWTCLANRLMWGWTTGSGSLRSRLAQRVQRPAVQGLGQVQPSVGIDPQQTVEPGQVHVDRELPRRQLVDLRCIRLRGSDKVGFGEIVLFAEHGHAVRAGVAGQLLVVLEIAPVAEQRTGQRQRLPVLGMLLRTAGRSCRWPSGIPCGPCPAFPAGCAACRTPPAPPSSATAKTALASSCGSCERRRPRPSRRSGRRPFRCASADRPRPCCSRRRTRRPAVRRCPAGCRWRGTGPSSPPVRRCSSPS